MKLRSTPAPPANAPLAAMPMFDVVCRRLPLIRTSVSLGLSERSEACNVTLQASLRSLSPNDTLVLINGKRRHTTSNIGIAASGAFAGGAGVDLNFIPANAIDHIEVLTDGAAAQYGSDAI